jgi:hypothetical protein
MAGTELDRLYYTVDYDLGPAMAKAKQLDGVSKTAGDNISSHFKRAAAGAEELHRGIEINRRELLYFGREAMTGDLARLPSTLLLIGTHLSGLTSKGILMGGAVLAPFAAMAVSAYQAEMAIDRVGRAIAATGSAAGLTKGQAYGIAQNLAGGGSDISMRGAMDVQSKLQAHGRVPGEDMQEGVKATYGYSKMSGLGLDKAAEGLEEMMKNPAKAAQDLHDNFNLLTDAQVRDIKQMKDRAAQEMAIFKALTDRWKQVEDSMWWLSKAFDGFGTWISNLWFKTGSTISGAAPLEQRATQANDEAQRMRWALGQHAKGVTPAMVEAAEKKAGDLHWQVGAGQRAAQAAEAAKKKDDLSADSRSPAAMELQKYRDEARVNSASPRDREMLRARLEANRQFTLNSNSDEPGMAPRAGAIRSATIGAAQAKQNTDRKEALSVVQQEAAGQERIAEAYRTSTSAGLAMGAQIKAEAEYRKGAINNINAYRDALLKSAEAERTEAQIKENLKASDSNAVLALEVSLLRTDESIRDRRVALMREELELKEKGFTATDKEYQQGMANAAQAASLAKSKRDITDEQQRELSVGKEYTGMIGSIFDHANEGAKGLKTLLPDLQQSLLKMFEKLAILNPLENALTGSVTGTKDKLPTFASAGNLFSILSGSAPKGAAGSKKGSGGGIAGFFDDLFGDGSAADGSVAAGSKVKGGGQASGPTHVTQMISVHPDVSAIARGEIVKAMPTIQSSAMQALNVAVKRGFQLGGMG